MALSLPFGDRGVFLPDMTLAKSDDPRHNLAPTRCQGAGLLRRNQIKLAALQIPFRHQEFSDCIVLMTIKAEGLKPEHNGRPVLRVSCRTTP
jgi:hypothetical protein